MFIKTVTNPIESRAEYIPLEVASDYCQERRISGGNYRLMRPEVILNGSNWLRLYSLFDGDIKLVLAERGFIRNLYLSLYVSN